MRKGYICFAVIAVVLLLFYAMCTSVVYQWEMAVLMSFGKPLRFINKPGIYFKFPRPFHRMAKFDGRLIMLQPKAAEFLTADKKNLILESAICYKIADPVLFMKTVRDKKGLEVRITDLVSSHTGLLLGLRELSEIVNVDPGKVKLKSMNVELTRLMRRDVKGFGIEIKQVFIKRIMLPYENRLAVYGRMNAERERIAKKYLAEGEEKALVIRAEADRASRIIIAKAKSRAAVIKGQADAKAMKIYGKTYRKNLEFYRYLRALEAYENMFNQDSVIILDDKSPILKTLFSGKHK
ncbi:MAG: protease modulator HflC [Candidatus Margulisiibacteriota bacterium]|nr:protease modulator HflC [Candidatus Margulisiibacteriota bacterium]